MEAIIIHFHEITLKGRNRPLFEKRLFTNIADACGANGIEVGRIHNIGGGFLIDVISGDEQKIRECFKKIPGIANFFLAHKAKDMPELKEKILNELKDKKFDSFRMTASRTDKSLPFTSEDMNKELGAAVAKETGKKVDLERAELNVFVFAFKNEFCFSFGKMKGLGGLPSGISGTAVSLLSGGIDSPVSSLLMLKRGLRLVFAHFHGYPYTSTASKEKAGELAKVLNEYQQGSVLYLIPFGDIQKKITLSVPAPYRIIIYRRMMLRIAEKLAEKEKAKALVTGENLGQVSSQTLDNMAIIQNAVSLPVLRPLLGADKEEIIEKAKEIGTYEISIRPDEDCCTLFTPKNPETHGKEREVLKAESGLDIPGFIDEAVEKAEAINF